MSQLSRKWIEDGAIDSNKIDSTGSSFTMRDINITRDATFAHHLISTVSDGTAPFIVTSTTKCPNLNADKIDDVGIGATIGYNKYLYLSDTSEIVGTNLYNFNGRVGVDTNLPQGLLSVRIGGSWEWGLTFEDSINSGIARAGFVQTDKTDIDLWMKNKDGTVVTIISTSGSNFFLGPVRIGSSALPSYHLQVDGTMYANQVISKDSTNSVGHFIMGNYHLWVDDSGKLRIKNGAPTSEADGTVVGSQ